MTQTDELLPIRNSYYLGAYAKTLADIQSLPPHAQQNARLIAYKSLIAQGNYPAVINSINPQRDPPVIIAIMILAKLSDAIRRNTPNKAVFIGDMQELLSQGGNALEPSIQYIAANAFYLVGDLEQALKLVSKSPKDMECAALAIQIYLKLDRVDIAKKELTQLKNWADDATLAQLVEAWVNLQAVCSSL